MTEHCTCGTQLVENASFCHRCGRPTRELSVEEAPPLPPQASAPASASVAPAPAQVVPVGFRNPLALRIAFVMSLGIMLLQLIPGLQVLFAVWWLGAGWSAVAVYRRLTGTVLSVRAGARLGSITGVLAFVSMTLTLALSMFFMGSEMLDEVAKQTPQIRQVIHDPIAMGTIFLMILIMLFVMVVGTCAAGGALGARFSARPAPGA